MAKQLFDAEQLAADLDDVLGGAVQPDPDALRRRPQLRRGGRFEHGVEVALDRDRPFLRAGLGVSGGAHCEASCRRWWLWRN